MAFRQKNLVADIANTARFTDPNLQNPWGLVVADNLWVTVNETNLLNVYSEQGELQDSIPVPDAPTGLARVPNPAIGGIHYVLVTEGGSVVTYNPSLQIPITTRYTDAAAVYKGVAIQGNRIYAADFAGLKVDVFDLNNFHLVDSTNLQDPALQAAGYGPFNVYSESGILFISYALLGENNDEESGPGNGYINAWFNGNLIRLASRGPLNSPWGMLLWQNSLLVGNFGDGAINEFNLRECPIDPCDPCSKTMLVAEFCQPIKNACGSAILIDGLWGIAAGSTNGRQGRSIYFAAGVQDEAHGLVGRLTPTRSK